MKYLMFVRSCTDLDRACREASDLLVRKSREPPAALHRLYGVWIESGILSYIPEQLDSPSLQANGQRVLVVESVGVAGVWELARLQLPAEVVAAPGFPELLVEALRGLAADSVGVFAPVLSGAMSRAAREEIVNRLAGLYPAGLAAAWIQDPNNGALECPPLSA